MFTTSGVAQWLACWAHNPKVRGSKPRSAIELPCLKSSSCAFQVSVLFHARLTRNEGREIRTPNLLIWSQTHCRCAIPLCAQQSLWRDFTRVCWHGLARGSHELPSARRVGAAQRAARSENKALPAPRSAMQQDPLQSSWLECSALTRATRARIPVAECLAALRPFGWELADAHASV